MIKAMSCWDQILIPILIRKHHWKQRIEILPFAAANVDAHQAAIFIRGNAFTDDHVEVARALELGVKMMTYPDAVKTKLRKQRRLP